MPITTIIILAIIVVVLLFLILTYNKLVKSRITVQEGFSTMDVYLKKRYDLIPNLVETVKGYEAYEKETLKEVVQARQQALLAKSSDEAIRSNEYMSQVLGKLIALAESYPDLKADKTYTTLTNNLSSIESDIANARLYYNGTVKIFNQQIVVFPTVLIAGAFGFHSYKFFESNDHERENIKIDLKDA